MQNITAESITEMVDIQGKTQYQLALDKGLNPKEALMEGNKHNRDKSRSPMQWDDTDFAGFSTSKSWIKINPNYKEINVKDFEMQKKSILNQYKALIALRNKEKTLQYGKYDRLELTDNQILYTRSFEGDTITAIINFGDEKKVIVPKGAIILMGSNKLKSNDYIIFKN